jgi:NTE family protein
MPLFQKQHKVGLALGSGGWRGLAHIGVIKSLFKHNVEIQAIAGSSAGSLVGGMFALWNDIERVEYIFNKLKYQDLLFAFSDLSAKLGFFNHQKTVSLFEKYIGKSTFDDVKIPFVAITTDIMNGLPITLSKGSLAEAIQASSSVPLVFEPPLINNLPVIDGGISNPVPVKEAKALGATKIIAVNLYQSVFPVPQSNKKLTTVDIAMLSTELMLNQLSKRDASEADILIEPKLKNAQSDPFLHFLNNQEAIDAGETAMNEQIDAVLKL